jgi:hypothetical protein
MANVDEVKAAFGELCGFLDKNLSDAQKIYMVYDVIMLENSLRKPTCVFEAKKFVIG